MSSVVRHDSCCPSCMIVRVVVAFGFCVSGCNCGGPGLTWNEGCGPIVARGCPDDSGVVAGDCGSVDLGGVCFSPGTSCTSLTDCNGAHTVTCQRPVNES